MAVISNIFNSAGMGTAYLAPSAFNAELRGDFNGVVQLERSLDGTNWVAVASDNHGNSNAFQRPASFTVTEPESTAQYRWNCVSYYSGTINARLSP
jgi:hypothetical protein